MELKEFVKQVLSDIALAVKESQDELEGVAVINAPSKVGKHATETRTYYDEHKIDFDIAVSASSESGKEAGVKVFSAVIGGLSTNTTSQEYSRVKFSIPIYFSRGEMGDFHIHVDKKGYPSPSYAEPKGKVT